MSMDRLTPRQREIVALRCGTRELTTAAVARELGLNANTVKNHGTAIIRRLGTASFHGVCRLYGEEQVRLWPVSSMRAEQV